MENERLRLPSVAIRIGKLIVSPKQDEEEAKKRRQGGWGQVNAR
jgi:hypothetical protein